MNPTKNVHDEKASQIAMLVRRDGNRVPKRVSEWVATIGTWGMEVRTRMMQAPLELVCLGSSSAVDSFDSWKMNDSGMEKKKI